MARPVKAVKRMDAGEQVRAALARARDESEEHEKWPSAAGIASLVNYASAPLGGQTYDAAWLASNTAVR